MTVFSEVSPSVLTETLPAPAHVTTFALSLPSVASAPRDSDACAKGRTPEETHGATSTNLAPRGATTAEISATECSEIFARFAGGDLPDELHSSFKPNARSDCSSTCLVSAAAFFDGG